MKLVNKWHNDGSAPGPRHNVVNPGPERTLYDVQRHERMRLRSGHNNNFLVSLQSTQVNYECDLCGKEIIQGGVIIFGKPYHEGCYARS